MNLTWAVQNGSQVFNTGASKEVSGQEKWMIPINTVFAATSSLIMSLTIGCFYTIIVLWLTSKTTVCELMRDPRVRQKTNTRTGTIIMGVVIVFKKGETNENSISNIR